MKKEVIFLPVKPEFSRKILDQSKIWEFRKILPKKCISHLVLYSSSPEKKVRAIVEVKSILSGSPSEVWEKTKDGAGTTKNFFFSYFKDRSEAHAFELGKITPLEPINPDSIGIKVPQSFIYLNNPTLKKIHQYEQNRVFIGGIHGIGKSTLIRSIKDSLLNSEHIICSQVIKYNESKLDVKKIDRNQDILVSSIERLAPQARNLLIDGHFSLFKKGEPKCVPLSTFTKLKINSIILLHGSPKKVLERLPIEKRELFSEETLTALQDLEIKQANTVAENLGIPILLFDPFDSAESIVIDFLTKRV